MYVHRVSRTVPACDTLPVNVSISRASRSRAYLASEVGPCRAPEIDIIAFLIESLINVRFVGKANYLMCDTYCII